MSYLIFPLSINSFLTMSVFYAFAGSGLNEEIPKWKAGVAKVVITPEKPMWMSGYSSRDRPSEGKLHDLWAKALAIEDAGGRQAVLVTADLRNFPKNISDRIRDRLEIEFQLSRAQIILNSSHTHTGPLLNTDKNDAYYLAKLDARQREKVRQYSDNLEDRIVGLVGKALRSMEPAEIFAENGVVRFAVNRRNNKEAIINQLTELQGPFDHSVPVIKVVNATGDLMAVAFGYACHPTVLDGYKFSGDYPGFAQIDLEKSYPGAVAMFFQGAGGDQNPLPRRSVALAQQYGQELAAAVRRVLDENMRQLTPRISMAYSEVDLSLTTPPTKEELSKLVEELTGSEKNWASSLLEQLERGQPLSRWYPYPVQVWQLGEQTIISLGGELVVDYAIEIKRILGQDTFVLGYSNDVMAYIPSARILREGGYEGESSQKVRGMASTWNTNIETVILQEVIKMQGEL